jgi:hypothetical protein
MTSQEIVKNYVFLTAGACGPCRFGMYVTEYRKALRDAGFDGFRVMLFQQTGGLKQATGDERRPRDEPDVLLGDRQGDRRGDALNALGYRIRPYEVVPGATNHAIEKRRRSSTRRSTSRRTSSPGALQGRRRVRARSRSTSCGEAEGVDHRRVLGDDDRGRRQLRPAAFLESEGAECDIQLVAAWLLYNIWEVRYDTRERADLRGADTRSTASAASPVQPSDRRRPQAPRDRCGRARRRCASVPDLRARRWASTATSCPTWTRSPRSRTSTTTTISAAAKATWRSAS